MWACLQDHDTANHWKQVAGWRKVCDLAQTHLGRLQQYRRGLAAAWPPETSAASRTYLAELDELIDKVQRTHDAAAANYTALSAATQAIGTTRAALQKIYEEYATKFQQKQAYESMVADPKAVMGNRVTEPPVADGDLERLNVQARSMMFNLSGELQQAQATLQKPPPRPAPRVDEEGAGTTTAVALAPIVPPIVPVPIRPPARIPSSIDSSASSPDSRLPATGGVGPVLGGATAVPVPTVGDLPRGQQLGHVNQASGMAQPPTLGGIPNASNVLRSPTEQRAPGLPSPNEPRTNGVTTPTTPRTMPPSGLIGGSPGLGFGQPNSGAAAPRRVNPIGGVIGGGSAGTAPTGGAGSRPSAPRASGTIGGMSPIGGAPGTGANRQTGTPPVRPGRWVYGGSDSESDRWDADYPWRTEQGVAPVVLPPDEDGPIDPGPALGLPR